MSMNNIIEINVCDMEIKKYEKEIIVEGDLDFLLNSSFISTQEDGMKNEIIVYSYEDHISINEYCRGLSDIFLTLNKYVKALMSARNYLLNTENISVDANRIFFSGRNEMKIIYAPCDIRNEIDKVCHLARYFAGWSDVVGAKTSMEMLIDRINNKNLSLKNCLKIMENVQREWNHIN